MPERFYISTSIPYVNADPHIGFALEAVQTDVLARWHALLGQDTFLLSGTDENSLKNVQAAEQEGMSTQELVDRNEGKFRSLEQTLDLSFTEFIRTSEPRHFRGAQRLWKLCDERGDIYRKHYSGLYCVGDETFLEPDDLVDGKCPNHDDPPVQVEEENYFFKLSQYQEQLRDLITSGQLCILPETRKNEVLAFIDSGLKDFSISRSADRARGWGVPVPGDPRQVMYVWFDALSNYITALDFADDGDLFKKWWTDNQNRTHVIGKDIVRFHAVYWPAMLLSAGLPIPSEIFVHGFITSEGKKMSKSLGNVVDPFAVVKKYGTDPVRFYLTSAVSSTEDGDFSEQRFRELYQANLANGIGNLLSRVLTLVEKNFDGKIPDKVSDDPFDTVAAWDAYRKSFDSFTLEEAIAQVFQLETTSNQLVDEKVLWELVKTDQDASAKVLYQLAEALRHMGWMLTPFMPGTARRVFAQLDPEGREQKRFAAGGFETVTQWGILESGAPVKKGEPLFPRLENE